METRLEQVRKAMEDYFGEDKCRIDHASRVTGYAEAILRHEPGERELVIATALLHDIGIPEAERKYGSAAGDLQEKEGPPVARGILEALGYPEAFIDEVCAIIASHHSPGEVETDNFKVMWDADWLVNLGDEPALQGRSIRQKIINESLMTDTGRKLATNLYLQGT